MLGVQKFLIFGSQITIHKFSKIKNAAKVLEVLLEISEAVHSTTNLNELYKVIHKSLGKVINTDNFFIAIHNKENDSISFPYHIDEKDNSYGDLLNFSKIVSLTGEVIIGKKPRLYTKKEIYDFAVKKNQCVVGTISKIWLGVPLIIKHEIIGVVVVQSYTSETTYKKSDLEILNSASQYIALAIEKQRGSDALKAQRKTFEKIIESTPVGIGLIKNRTFKQVNNELVKLFGYNSKDDLQNKSLRMIYASEEDYLRAGEIMRESLAKNGRADFESELVRKDGTPFPAQIILASAGKKSSYELTIDIIIDLSKRKNAQVQKIQHEKLQGVLEIAGAVCHELNQPLKAILDDSELMTRDHNLDRKAVNKKLTNIVDQIMKIGKIIKKVAGITQYKTIKYTGDTKIFDIWNCDDKK